MTLQALNNIAITRGAGNEVDYLCFAEVPMTGLLVLGFCKTSIKWKINKIATTKIKQGLGGKAGNKGSVIVRFCLDNTSFIVANCHLESGHKNVSDRLMQFKEIINDSLIGKRNRNYDFKSHNVKFLMGDLNFRIDLDYEIAKVYSKTFTKDTRVILQKYDQLLNLRQVDPEMQEICEGPLNFRPTYKYDANCNEYDTSKKQRVPAWCDRILWFKNEKHVEQLTYERKESTFSDHRPVLSYMSVMTYSHDNKLMRELKDQMIRKRKEEYFASQADSYFMYAMTGQFKKRNQTIHESENSKQELVSEKTKKLLQKRNTVNPEQIDLGDDQSNPLRFTVDVVQEEEEGKSEDESGPKDHIIDDVKSENEGEDNDDYLE